MCATRDETSRLSVGCHVGRVVFSHRYGLFDRFALRSRVHEGWRLDKSAVIAVFAVLGDRPPTECGRSLFVGATGGSI